MSAGFKLSYVRRLKTPYRSFNQNHNFGIEDNRLIFQIQIMSSQAKDAVQILQSNRKIIITSLGIENHIQTDASNTNHMFAHRSYFCQLSLSQLWMRRTNPKLLRH